MRHPDWKIFCRKWKGNFSLFILDGLKLLYLISEMTSFQIPDMYQIREIRQWNFNFRNFAQLRQLSLKVSSFIFFESIIRSRFLFASFLLNFRSSLFTSGLLSGSTFCIDVLPVGLFVSSGNWEYSRILSNEVNRFSTRHETFMQYWNSPSNKNAFESVSPIIAGVKLKS